jgi:hypothetical protein
MTGDEVSAEARSFLCDNVESYEQLETLLLMHRDRGQVWLAESVASALNMPVALAADALDHLHRRNLIDSRLDAGARSFRFKEGNAHVERCVSELAQVNDANRLAVINLMTTNAIERVRTQAMRVFSDAFILGRNKKDGNG